MTSSDDLENEAGDLLARGANPRQALALLAQLSEHPLSRPGWLRSQAWVRIARREGPSDEAERWLSYAFEAGLADPGEGELVLLRILQPFPPWYEYLVMFGRFAEAQAARARATALVGPSHFARPRPHVRALVEELTRIAGPNVSDEVLQPGFVPRLAASTKAEDAELRVSRLEGVLPNGRPLEMLFVAFPVPLFTGEPLWFAYARLAGGGPVRTFALEWSSEENAARPAEWIGSADAQRRYGACIAAGAPRPDLVPTSPYLAPFAAFIGQQMMLPPASAPQSFAPSAPPSRSRARIVFAALGSLVLLLAVALGVWRWRQVREQEAFVAYHAAVKSVTKPVAPSTTPFSCGHARDLAGDFTLVVRDEVGVLTATPAVYAAASRPPLVLSGVIRKYDLVPPPGRNDQEVDMDFELLRVDVASSVPRVVGTPLCQGHVKAFVVGGFSEKKDLAAIADRLACKGLALPICEHLAPAGIRIVP